MLIDSMGNQISVVLIEGFTTSVTGKPGSGKTFYNLRNMETLHQQGVQVVVVDFSGSYTDYELKKGHFAPSVPVKVLNPKEEVIELYAGSDIENVADALSAAMGITAMTQSEILLEACEELMRLKQYISFQNLFVKLGDMAETSDDSKYLDNIAILRRRLYHMKNICSLRIVSREIQEYEGVTIMQISEYTERIRKTLAQFILEVEWRNIRLGNKCRKRRSIILDEFQLLDIRGTAVEEMIREGRRYGLGVVLLSQYMPKAELADIVQQAAASMYFKPNDKNIISTAKMINPERYQEWVPILKNLKRGEAVLAGTYTVNGNSKIVDSPVLVRVVPDNAEENIK